MFEHMKMSNILNLGFGILLSLIITVSIVAYNGLSSASNGFTQYRSLAIDTNLAGRLQANMLLARLYVKEFFKTGRQQSVLNYQGRLERLETFLAQAKQQIEQKDRAQHITLIDNSLDQYVRNFELIIDFKHQRDELVFNQLDPSGRTMRTRLTEIMVSAFDDKDLEAAYYAGRLQEHVLLARLYANKFLNTNDLTAAARSQQEIAQKSTLLVDRLGNSLENPKRKSLFAEFLAERKTYQEVFEQIQALIVERNQIIDTQLDRIGPIISTAAEEVKLSVKNDQDILGPALAKDNEQAVLFIGVISAITIIIATFLSWFIGNKIKQPIGGEPKNIMDITRQLARGETDIHYQGKHEQATGIMASILLMVEELKKKVVMAEQIAGGDLNTELQLSSESDTLGKALQGMVKQLKKRSDEIQQENEAKEQLLQQMESQDWLKTNLASVIESAQGQTTLVALAKQLIKDLARISHAGHGVFYILDYDESAPQLSLLASYAYNQRKNLANTFGYGEGLVGQCALEKETIMLTQVPPDYIHIGSGLGEASPLNIIVLPILFNNECLAVVELASFRAFSSGELELVTQVTDCLGVIVNSAKSREKIEALLVLSEEKSRELKLQSDKLQSQQEALQDANESLQQQTLRLTASEEELKQQSEELRVSNEELEEQQRSLTLQRDEIKNAKDELTLRAEELTRASKYKSQFLANMSHELRTPLNSLLILAKGLSSNRNDNLNETEVEDAKVIYEGGNNLLLLINDILDLSKVEAGKLIIHSEQVRLAAVAERLRKTFQPMAENKQLDFIVELSGELPECLITDAQRVEQILRNLLSNALKFTLAGQVTLAIKPTPINVILTNGQLRPDASVAFAVTDTGVGIADDKRQDIFEAFQQEDGSTSRKFGGTGLGLTIARELTQLLGGEIQVESVRDKGSCFTLYLPIKGEGVLPGPSDISEPDDAPVDEPLMAEGQPAAYPPQFINDDRDTLTPGDKSLLVIDDDKHFARCLLGLARQQGYKCLVTGDGRSGLYLAQHHQPSGIILDVGLPDINGHQVLEQLKANAKTSHIPVQFITAKDEHPAQILQQGAIGFLNKPVQQEQLETVLSEISKATQSEMGHLLVIENDDHHRLATTKLLESQGADIDSVASGEAACTAIINHHYDCIILDLGLSDMSGFDVLRKINDEGLAQVPPVIIYTGKELSDDEEALLAQYGSSIVIKGVGSPERLLDDVSLFIHEIESKSTADQAPQPHKLHDEDMMLKGRHILLVDDDMRNSYALSKHLIEVGFNAEMVHDGQEAVTLLETNHDYELILMDTMMPVMDGNEATRLIRQMEHYKDIPIIALTAKTMPEDREKCLQAGASEYLTKPIDMEKLLSVMRIWLFRSS